MARAYQVDEVKDPNSGKSDQEHNNTDLELHYTPSVAEELVIILDALDECNDAGNFLSRWIQILVKIMCTSRRAKEQIQGLSIVPSLAMGSENLSKNIREYVEFECFKSPEQSHALVRSSIDRDLQNRCRGMYSWVALVVKELSKIPILPPAVSAKPIQMITSDLEEVGLGKSDQEYNYGDFNYKGHQEYNYGNPKVIDYTPNVAGGLPLIPGLSRAVDANQGHQMTKINSALVTFCCSCRYGNHHLRCVDKKQRRPPPSLYHRELFVENAPSFTRVLTSALDKLIHRIRMVSPAKSLTRLMLWSPLLFLPTANALTPDDASGLHNSRGMEDLGNIPKDLLSVSPLLRPSQKIPTLIYERQIWTHSLTNRPIPERSMKPATLLLATFLSTSVVACAARAGKKDIYQARIMGFCALGAAIAGAVREAELIDFIFAYLLWGCIVGVGGSWIVHRFLNWG